MRRGSNSGTITGNVAVGGTGGNGGDTYYNGSGSQVTNTGTITTFGADAHAILAQSVGGGGGAGGKAGTSMGDAKSNNDGSNGASGSVSSTTGAIAQNFAANGASAMNDYDELAELLVTTNQLLGNATTGSATTIRAMRLMKPPVRAARRRMTTKPRRPR